MLISQYSFSQNLVKNGDFETFDNCPNNITLDRNFFRASHWYSPTGTTPDYFNSCCKNRSASTPRNHGGYQKPRSGNGYVRILMVGNAMEYVRTELIQELERGVEYYVEFWVSKQERAAYASNCLGVRIGSNNKIKSFISTKAIEVKPQIISDKYIRDTEGWTKISGTFKAKRGYKYLTIGYFPTYSKKKASRFVKFKIRLSHYCSGYYIDDVKLIKVEKKSEGKIEVGKKKYKSNLILIEITESNQILIEDKLVSQSTIIKRVEQLLSQVSNSKDSEIINFKIQAEPNTLMKTIEIVKKKLKDNYPNKKILYESEE